MVLDTFPLIAVLLNEPDADEVGAQIDQADGIQMSVVNFGEVSYQLERRVGARAAKKAMRQAESATELIPATVARSLAAARLKAKGGVAYADCFAAALALELDTFVLTKDPEFERFRKFGVDVKQLSERV